MFIENAENACFSIGEFAQLCSTTRQTLYYYEKNELLLPTVDNNNGYRFYGPKDYYTFMYIAHLSNIGFSIREIKEILADHDLSRYIEALKASDVRLQDQLDKIRVRKDRTNRGYEHLKRKLNKPLNQPQIVYIEEEYFFRIPLPESATEKDSVTAQSNADTYAAEHHLDRERHYLGFLSEDPFQEPIQFNYLLAKMHAPVSCNALYTRPAGMYLSMTYSGSFLKNTPEAFALIKKYLTLHRFKPTSAMLVDVVVGPFYSRKEEEYISELTIRIE